MKAAVMFLFFVTEFTSNLLQQSSAAATADYELTCQELVKQIINSIENREEALCSIAKGVNKALVTTITTGDNETRDRIIKVKNWLYDFVERVNFVHEEFLKAIMAENIEAIKRVVPDLSKAIQVTEASSPKVSKYLEFNPELKALFEDKVQFIVNNGKKIRDDINNVSAGEEVDAAYYARVKIIAGL